MAIRLLQAIIDFVDRLNAYGIAVILDLHWTAPGANVPYGQQPMPSSCFLFSLSSFSLSLSLSLSLSIHHTPSVCLSLSCWCVCVWVCFLFLYFSEEFLAWGPDTDHDIDFWKSVATAFSSNSAVIFDLFNEPYPDNNQDTSAAWSCMANGGKSLLCPFLLLFLLEGTIFLKCGSLSLSLLQGLAVGFGTMQRACR